MELAQEYRTKLLDAVADLDDDIMMMVLEGEDVPTDMIRAALRKGTIDEQVCPRDLRHLLPQQGRPEAAGRHHRLYARSHRHPRHHAVSTPRPARRRIGMPATTSPSPLWRSRSCTDPYVGQSDLLPRVLRHAECRRQRAATPPRSKRERFGRMLQMHANHREDIETVYAGDIAAAVGLKNTTTGDTLCDEKHPIILESMEFPEPVIRVAIEPKTKAGQEKMGYRSGQAGRGRPHLQDLHRRRDRSDHHRRHGRAPPGDHRGPSAPRVQGGGQRGRASGRLQGDHHQEGRSGDQVRPSVRRYAASTATSRSLSSPTSPARVMSSSTLIVGGAIPKEYIPAIDAGIQGAHAGRCSGRLSRRGRQGHPV